MNKTIETSNMVEICEELNRSGIFDDEIYFKLQELRSVLEEASDIFLDKIIELQQKSNEHNSQLDAKQLKEEIIDIELKYSFCIEHILRIDAISINQDLLNHRKNYNKYD